jgi:hypothetical protein
MITIVKAILSALNAEGGMAMFSLLFWGGIGLFGLVNLVVSPFTSDIGLFAGLASTHPKLSIFLLIMGVPSTLMFGMFAYMWGIMEMVYTYRHVMITCIVYDSTGESITITTHNKKGVIERMKHIIKNILSVVVVVVVSGCGDGDHAFRSERLMNASYPTHCQRDINGDGWYTLIEGAEALYGELGPCPTCVRIGVVPVYMQGTDTTPEDRDQVFKRFRTIEPDAPLYKEGGIGGMDDILSTCIIAGLLLALLYPMKPKDKKSHTFRVWEWLIIGLTVTVGATLFLEIMVLFTKLVIAVHLATVPVIHTKGGNKMKNLLKEIHSRFTRMRQMWILVGKGGGLYRYNKICPMCTKHAQEPTSVITMLSAALNRGHCDRKEALAHQAELIDQGISYPVCLDCGQKVALTLCDQSYREENDFDQELMLEEYKGKCWRYGLKLSLQELFREGQPYWPKA